MRSAFPEFGKALLMLCLALLLLKIGQLVQSDKIVAVVYLVDSLGGVPVICIGQRRAPQQSRHSFLPPTSRIQAAPVSSPQPSQV